MPTLHGKIASERGDQAMYQPNDTQMPGDHRHQMLGEGESNRLAWRPRVRSPQSKSTLSPSKSRLLRVVCAPGGFAFVEERSATHKS